MAIQGVVLAKCSFCEGRRGEIYLDAVAFERWCARIEDVDDPRNLGKVPGQKIVMYDRDDPNAGPCQHLIMLALNLTSDTVENHGLRPRAAVDYDLVSPAAKEADPEDTIIGNMWQEAPLLDDAEVERADTPNRVLDIGVEWSKLGNAGNSYPRYHVGGNVAFAADVRRFIEELKAHDDAMSEAWRRSSQNPANAS